MPYFGGSYRPKYTSSYGSGSSYSAPTTDSRRRRHVQLGESVEGRTNTFSDDAFHRRMKALHADDKKPQDSQLHATSVDFHTEKNREAHHTCDYELNNLIVRRGQEFELSVTFDRPLDPKRDRLILQFITGSRPQESKNSLIRVKETKQLSTSSWGMRIGSTSGATVSLRVMSPADAFVGEYSVYVETKTKKPHSEEEMSFRQKRPEKIYILFNAWVKDDAVYIENDAHRKEYVLNDHGRIWIGSIKKMISIPWNFGQFEAVALTVFARLMELSNLGTSAKGNPTSMSRVISRMSNYNDRDGGVLYGRWSQEYPQNCTKPTEWVGSVAILKKFDQLHQVVRYGQCWVFSGLVTTLLRAIGIPTRSVTNFQSAHDSDHSMTIDYHFDFEGKPMDELNDSVWNFHVWNESYFARPDLPPGYGGWQAHDPTPQETSDGVFRCGPCPVKAVKSGEVYLPYDTGFVFAEVNGDKVYWSVDITGEMSVTYIDKKSVGKFISTKAVGSNERDDITKNYKFDEGSAEERKAVELAYKYSSRKDRHIYSKPSSNDVSFEIRTGEHTMITMIGEDFQCELFIKNSSRDKRTIQVAIVSKVAFYTGINAKDLKDLHKEVTMRGGENISVLLPIKSADYVNMASDSTFNVFYKATVKETGQVFSNMEAIELCKPFLQIDLKEIQRDLKLKEMFDITFSFLNPLPIPLTNGVLNVECRKMQPGTITKRLSKPIGPKEQMSLTVTMESVTTGFRVILGSFKSDQICGIRGELEHNII